MPDGELHGRMSATSPSEHFCLRVAAGGCNSGASKHFGKLREVLRKWSREVEGWEDFGILAPGFWMILESLNLLRPATCEFFFGIAFAGFHRSKAGHVRRVD